MGRQHGAGPAKSRFAVNGDRAMDGELAVDKGDEVMGLLQARRSAIRYRQAFESKTCRFLYCRIGGNI